MGRHSHWHRSIQALLKERERVLWRQSKHAHTLEIRFDTLEIRFGTPSIYATHIAFRMKSIGDFDLVHHLHAKVFRTFGLWRVCLTVTTKPESRSVTVF